MSNDKKFLAPHLVDSQGGSAAPSGDGKKKRRCRSFMTPKALCFTIVLGEPDPPSAVDVL
jgi:hypothetical protein